jgi:hypothetical protein
VKEINKTIMTNKELIIELIRSTGKSEIYLDFLIDIVGNKDNEPVVCNYIKILDEPSGDRIILYDYREVDENDIPEEWFEFSELTEQQQNLAIDAVKMTINSRSK